MSIFSNSRKDSIHTWGNGNYCLQVKVNSLDWKRRKIPLSQAGEGGWTDTENESC